MSWHSIQICPWLIFWNLPKRRYVLQEMNHSNWSHKSSIRWWQCTLTPNGCILAVMKSFKLACATFANTRITTNSSSITVQKDAICTFANRIYFLTVYKVAKYVKDKHNVIPIIWDDMLRQFSPEMMKKYGFNRVGLEIMIWTYIDGLLWRHSRK